MKIVASNMAREAESPAAPQVMMGGSLTATPPVQPVAEGVALRYLAWALMPKKLMVHVWPTWFLVLKYALSELEISVKHRLQAAEVAVAPPEVTVPSAQKQPLLPTQDEEEDSISQRSLSEHSPRQPQPEPLARHWASVSVELELQVPLTAVQPISNLQGVVCQMHIEAAPHSVEVE